MRDFKGMKRQRGRNRGGGGSGNKPQQHNANRAFDSNGPEGIKVRGNAQHVFDKYQQLARDASSGGDRVLAENYLQHAEHYFRLIRATQPNRAITDIVGRDTFSSGYDIDFEDESGAQAYAEVEQPEVQQNDQNGQGGQDGNGQRNQNDRYQSDRNNGGGGDRPRYDNQNRNRDDRPRDDRPRDDRPRDDNQNRNRDDRPRDDRPRDERPREEGQNQNRNRDRYEGRRNRDDRPREEARDPLAVVEPQATPLPKAEPEVRQEPAPRLRSSEGDESHAPAFLRVRPQIPAAAEPAAEEAKPKRRRTKATDAPASEEA